MRSKFIISGITNMVKVIILVINNIPQKTYRIAQYTDSWNRLDPLGAAGGPCGEAGDCLWFFGKAVPKGSL